MDRRLHLAPIAGIALLALGGIVILGWLLRVPAMVQIVPGYIAMAFNTAACFVLSGVALLLPDSRPQWQRRGRMLIGVVIFIVSALVLAQNVFDITLGIDARWLHEWLQDPNPHPGRMAPNTAVAFMFAGATLSILHSKRTWTAPAAQLLTFGVLLIGLISLVAYTLRLDLLYRWYQYTRMAIHTAAGFLLLGTGLASLWYNSASFVALYKGHEDRKIGVLAAAILISVAFSGGLLSFVILEEQTERALINTLEIALFDRIELLRTSLDEAATNAQAAAHRLLLVRQMGRLNLHPENNVARADITRVAQNLMNDGFSAVRLNDRAGHVVAEAGRFMKAPTAALSPRLQADARLLWDKSPYLRISIELKDGARGIGRLTTEQRLPALAHALSDIRALGTTGEAVICTRVDMHLDCLPTRLTPLPFRIEIGNGNNIELPMVKALDGRRDVGLSHDYRRQNTIAAYGPVGATGLGLVIKMDTAELYAPIRDRLQSLVPLLLVLVVGGVLILRWQVVPLVQQLVLSEHAAVERSAALSRLAAIVESSNDAIIGLDLAGRITSWNRAAERMYGYSAEEAVGASIALLAPPALKDDELKLIERIRTGESLPYYETVRVTKQGKTIDVSLTMSPIRNADGEVIALSKIARDIGERKRAERALADKTEELAHSNKELEQFAYVASHDLQEPLRMIGSYTQLLLRRYRSKLDQDADEFIGYVVDGVKRMQTLIQDLLAYSRVGTQGMPFTAVDFEAILAQTLRDLTVARRESGAEIVHDRLPTLNADAVQIAQLWQNLIGNAIKFRSDQPLKIHIGSQLENDTWHFKVSDNGIGIEPQYAERIFIIFQRLHTRDRYPGTGIGLAICKKIVERHGGRIWIESQLGHGTIVHFTLPNHNETE